jgi:hypothetical protein
LAVLCTVATAFVAGSLTGGFLLDVLKYSALVSSAAATGVTAAVMLNTRDLWEKFFDRRRNSKI